MGHAQRVHWQQHLRELDAAARFGVGQPAPLVAARDRLDQLVEQRAAAAVTGEDAGLQHEIAAARAEVTRLLRGEN